MLQLQPIQFNNYKAIILGLSTAHFAFNSYLKYRQYKAIQDSPVVPNGVAFKTISDNKDTTLVKATSKLVNHWKLVYKFNFISDSITLIEDFTILKLDLLPKLWYYSGEVVSKWFTISFDLSSGNTTQSLVFLTGYTFISFIPDLALRYKSYTIEKHYGSKQSLRSWYAFQLKSFILNNLAGTSIVGLGLKLLKKFWNRKIVFFLTLLIISYNITTLLISPSKLMENKNNIPPSIHNSNIKQYILQDISLRKSINELAKQMDFQLDAICIVNKFQNWKNGHVSIIGPLQFFKIGYVSEDLINNSYNDSKQKKKLLALLAHEMSHWTLNHFVKLTCYNMFWGLFGLQSLNSFLTDPLFYSSLGFSLINPQVVGLVIFARFVRGHLNNFFCFLNNLVINLNILESDSYVVSLGLKDGLKRALIDQINEEGLSNLNKDWLYSLSCSNEQKSNILIGRIIRIDKIEDEMNRNTK